jgi:hypothetical protein
MQYRGKSAWVQEKRGRLCAGLATGSRCPVTTRRTEKPPEDVIRTDGICDWRRYGLSNTESGCRDHHHGIGICRRGGSSRCRRNRRNVGRTGTRGAHARLTATRQKFTCHFGTTPAAGSHAQFVLQIGERFRAPIHAGLDLLFGNGITYANVHENNYRYLFAFTQVQCVSIHKSAGFQ